MTLDEIIKKQKDHLTQAQIKQLAEHAERYKLLNAQRRAEAQSQLALQSRQALRGLQNVGLAGREGKLISGTQAAKNDALGRAYETYDRQLRNVENALTEVTANRMVNANIEAQRRAAQEQAERQRAAMDAEYQQAEQDYFVEEAKYNARLRKQAQEQANKQLLPEDYFVEEAKYNARLRQKARAEAQKQYDRDLNQAEQDYFVDEAKYNARLKARNPEAYNAYKQAESIIEQNAAKWDAAINNGKSVAKSTDKLTQRNTTYEQGSNERTKAIDEMERALSQMSRAAVALEYPQYTQYLMMTDDQFAVSFAAAEQLYNKRMLDAAILRKDSSESMDDLTAEASNIEAQAHKEFAPWEQVRRLRENTSDIPALGSTITIPDADKTKDKQYSDATQYVSENQENWHAVSWANEKEWNGQNWKTAKEKGWSASDYKGKSKYDALVNEWAYINGRTALLYTQKFNTVQSLGNIKDLFTDDVTRNKAYHWFRDECMKAFGSMDGNVGRVKEMFGYRSEREQMDAMLTLANLMTDEERARFNGMLETYGPKYADEYFEYLYNEVLPQRMVQYAQGQMAFDTRNASDRLLQSIMSVPTNILQSGQGVKHTMATRQTDPVAAQLGAQKYNMAQSMREAVGQHYGKVGNFLYQTAMSMADSATVALISGGIGNALEGVGVGAKLAGKAGSLIGGSILGASAFNSSYQEALDRGLSPEKARLTAFGNGVNEMLFESLSLDMLVGHFQKGGILKVSKKAWVNWLVNTLVQGGVEGSEEFFTDMANNLWDKKVNGIYSEELTKLREYISQGMSYDEAKRKVNAEFAEQLGMSFLGGFVSGGVMGGGASFLGMLQGQDVAKIGRNLDDAAKAKIREYDFKNEEAKEILTGKLTDEDYGRLAMTRLEEMAQTNPIAADKAAQSLIDAMARTDVKVDKRNQTLKTGTENSVSFNYDGVTDVKQMSGVQVEALRFAQTLVKSKVGGVNINVANQLYDKNGNEQNGWYDAKTNTVHVSLNGSQSVVYTISHELTHRLKSGNEEAYSSMRDAMKDELESLDLTGSDLPGEYENILGDYLVKDGEQRTAWEALIDYEMDRYAKHGITLDRESAEEEVVCRACETMLERSRLISSMISKNVRGAKTIAKFLASIYDDIASLKEEAESRGYVDGSPEKLFIDQYTDVEKIANAWANAMKTVSEKEEKRKPKTERIAKSKNGDYARLSKSETAKASGNIDVTDDITAEGVDGKPLSIKSLDFDMHSGKMYKDLVEHGVMTEEEVVKYDRFLKALIAYIKPNRVFLDMNESYTKDNRPFTAFKDNSDPLYKLSLDFSTLCRKRLTTQYIIEKLQMKLKKALSAEEQLAVRAMLKDYQKIDKGLQVACGMCYVEAARYKSPKQINMWLESDGRRKAMVQYFAVTDKQFTETVKQKQAEWKARHGYADNATKKEMSSADVTAFNKMSYDLRQAYEMDEEHQAIMDKALSLPKEQFLSAANLAELAEGDEAERTIYNAYTRFIRAATRSKSLEADIPYYYGDSESRVSDTFIENVNAENGMRFDSWSDFQFTHLLDMITAITDLSVRGSAMHGYTKFPEFVRIFGKTGAMFNLSGVPQGIGLKQDGSLDFSPTESINEEEAIKLREEFPETAGFQSIGINDRHINALLDSDFIDYVIPYHVSGMNAKLRSIAKIAGWQDYTGTQNAKIDKTLDGNKASCDPSVWHVEPVFSEFFVGYNTGMSGIDAMRASAKRYVDMCHERGMKPKFEQFLENDNYWKLLIDRKMINQKTGALIEQKAVKPNFDLNTIKREIDKYVNSYDQNREENAFQYISERWDEVPALVAKLEKEGKAEKKRQKEAAKNINMLKGEMVNAVPGRIPAKAAAQKFSIKESDAQYMDLARRYESGDKSVEADLQKAVDAAAKAAGYSIKAFHGTTENFNVFSRKQQGANHKGYLEFGAGFYFTPSETEAEQWVKRGRSGQDGKAPIVMSVYLNPMRMLSADESVPGGAKYLRTWLSQGEAEFIAARTYRFINYLIEDKGFSNVEAQETLKALGYDAIEATFKNGTEGQYVVFDPSQVKSADLITKDDNGNIIPLSERFKTDRTGEDAWKNEDIRYSLKDTVEGESLGKDYLKYLQLGTKVVNQTATEDEIRDFKQRMNALSQDNREAFLDKLREKLIRADEAEKVREVRDRQIAALKEELKQARERRAADREARKRDDIKRKIQKGSAKITQMLAHPTEARHVPVPLAKEVIEFMTMLNDFMNATVSKDAAEPMTKHGKAIAEKLKQVYDESFTDQETIKKAQEENPEYNPLGNKINEAFKDVMLSDMIKVVGDVISEKRVDNLTSEELSLINDVLRGVTRTVLDANKLVQSQIKADAQEAGLQMMSELRANKKMNRAIRFYLEESLDLRRIARIFSMSNDDAVFVKLANELNEGAIEKERIAQVLQRIFDPVTEKYGDEIRKWYGKDAEWINTGIEYKGREVRITKGMRVSLALHVLNEGNMKHIKNGGITIPDEQLYKKGHLKEAYADEQGSHLVRLDEEDINKIISDMTDAEKAYLEVAKDFFHNRTGYYINRTSLATVGYRKAMVKNYFPIHTDGMFKIKDLAQYFMQNGSVEGFGFLKDRVSGSNPILLEDITSVINRQIKGVSLYAGLAPAVRNWNAVLNAQEWEQVTEYDKEKEENKKVWRPFSSVEKTMTTVMGEEGVKVVKGFLADVQELNHVDVTPMERFAGKLATNYVKAVLLGNLKVAMKQVASYPTAAAVIPWKYLGKALFKGGRSGRMISRADVDLINQYTPLYQMRREGNANEIASIMAKRGMEQKLPWLLGWITKMDVMTVGRLWSAAEYMVADQQNLPVGSDEYYKAVAKVFNDTIQQTQPNFTPLQRNAALRSKNPVVRSLVLFGTQRMQNGGILIEAAMDLKHSKGKSKAEIKAAKMKLGRAVASQIVQNILLIVASLGVDALRGRMKGWQDDDKEITAESLAKGMGDMFLSNFIGSFLGGSETYSLISGLFKKAMGETAYDTEFTVPALDAVKTLINFAQSDVPDAVKYLLGDHTDEEKQKKAINFSYQLAKAFGYATGIPLENALKDVFKGIIPAIEDIRDAVKTGELNPWLHQSGKLDKKTTNANYKEWTNNGFKGSEYFYWENVLSAYGKREEKIPVLLEADLPNEKKAMLLRMMDKSGATSEGTVVYKSNGDVLIDFANPTEMQQALPKPKDAEMTTLEKLQELSKGGNVKLWNRPIVSGEDMQKAGWTDVPTDSYATVYTSTYGYGNRWMNFTPIKANGEILSPEELDEYAEKVINGEKDTLKLKIGGVHQTLKDAENAAELAHELSELYYGEEGNEPKSVLSEAKQEGVSEAVASGVEKDIATEAFLAYQNMGKNKSDDYSRNDDFRAWLFANVDSPEQRAVLEYQVIGTAKKVEGSVTYRESGVVFRDYTNESWFKLSEHNLSKDGTNKRYEAGKRLEKTGLPVDKTVAIYDALAEYTKKSEWTEYLKKQGLTDEQVNIFLWSRGWAKLK